ncbi:hypothetical protein SARC_13466 [Sphaeroforma arctica JP610]|uniref:Serine hydrolase domain-containing protein n=1 Tax=Sphaeroforma arctica JP610 TaxID=667725 RepID=A0A0L0FB81_9EUKA|nr:hypothetical protein SARC_13466 [Sphaeroforma arctica JP610]KNC73977.1 hypothetical protein SARC_13466 [Sphaeroforma arctica JP610]|eukprot:XP_014147879.1 hypothetical protein SARC_13466 [Sphaeroforma arctica JP610]
MKLKVLCIHGFGQTPEMFRAKSGSLRQALKKKCEFVFVQAPHMIRSDGDAAQISVDIQKVGSEDTPIVGVDNGLGFAWWTIEGRNRLSENWDPLTPPVEGQRIVGLEDSLRLIDFKFRTEGPFHGCFAFSQGASFLSILAAIAERNRQLINPRVDNRSTTHRDNEKFSNRVPADIGLNIQFKFGIFVSGFFPQEIAIREYIRHHMQATDDAIKTVHIYGTTDQVIPASMSIAYHDFLYSSYSRQATVLMAHEGGHFVPHERSIKAAVVSALHCFSPVDNVIVEG